MLIFLFFNVILKLILCFLIANTYVFAAACALDDDLCLQQRSLTLQQIAIAQAKAIAHARIAFNEGLQKFFLDNNVSDDHKLTVAMPWTKKARDLSKKTWKKA